MSHTYIVIFLPNYIVLLLIKSIHVTVNNIIIKQMLFNLTSRYL